MNRRVNIEHEVVKFNKHISYVASTCIPIIICGIIILYAN